MSTQPVLFVQGSKETLKSFRGARYRSIDYAAIVDLVRSPAARPKSSAPAIIPSSYLGHDGRSHQVQRDHGSFQFLCVDIDQGNPSLEQVAGALAHVIGDTAFIIYSTSSAKPVARKWRVLIPLETAIAGRDYTAVASRFFDLMGVQGIICDPALARTGQLVYLPNVPPDRREGGRPDGAPLFYEFQIYDGPLFDPSPLIPAPWAAAAIAADRSVQALRNPIAKLFGSKHVNSQSADRIPEIARYNQQHPLEAQLARYRFKPDGSGNWQSPYQKTGFATKVLGNRWFSLSTNDVDMGHTTDSGGTFGDAFDLLVHFEFGGNFAEALASIRETPAEPDAARYVRLPGAAGKPLCVAMGLQNAHAINAAMGLEVLAIEALADIKALSLDRQRKVLVALPDYPRNSPSFNHARQAVRNLRRLGHDVQRVTPWSPARGDGSGLYDLMALEGDKAMLARFAAVLDQPTSPRREVSLSEGTAILERAVSSFFEAAFQPHKSFAHALRASVGLGKTYVVLKDAHAFVSRLRATGDQRVFAYAVPTHTLSEQVAADFEKTGEGLRAAVWRGREAVDPLRPDGGPMCRNLDAVREAEDVLADIEKEVCKTCPHASACSYLAQAKVDADFWVVAHQCLFTAPPKPIADRGVAVTVIDEGFHSAGLVGIDEALTVSLNALEPGAMPVPDGKDGKYLKGFREVLLRKIQSEPDGPIRLGQIRGGNKSLFPVMAADCRRMEFERRIKTGPLKDRLTNCTIIPLQELWRAVGEIDLGVSADALSGRISLERDKKTGIRQIRIRSRRPIHRKWRVPTLVIDATLEIELLRSFLPNVVELPEISVAAPYQRIIQAADRALGKSALLPREKGEPPPALLNKLRCTLMELERHYPANLLAVGHKATIEALKLPDRIQRAWFNGLAGRNDWQSVAAIAVISRPLPPPNDLETIAGALSGYRVEPVGEWYPQADVQRLVRRGERIEVLADTGDWHPDPTVRALMRAIAVGQVVQTIGRGRGIRRDPKKPTEAGRDKDKPLVVYVLSNVALPIPVDEFVDSDDLIVAGPRETQLAAAGIAFAEPGAAARAYPDLFKSPEAAKKAFQREKSGTFPCEEPITGKCPPLRFLRYRLSGQGQRPAQVFIDVRDEPFPRDVIEDRLGPIAEMTRYWQIGDGRLVPAGPTVADMPRDEREPITRFLDIMSAYADLLRSPTSELTKAHAAAFMTRWLTDAMEWEWTAPELFGSQGRDGIIRMLEGRAIVELGERAIVLEGGDTLMRPPPLRP